MERTLLLVDDEEEIILALKRLFRRDGYTLLHANSGRHGLELLAQHKVDVVISDLRMPEMSGVEFLTQVREHYPHTVRIILSGHADLDSVTEAINHGAVYKFLTKPWDNETMRSEVFEAFDRCERLRQKEALLLEIQGANVQLAKVNLELALAMERKNALIDHLTHFDALTRLPNRALFLDRLQQSITRAERDQSMLGVLSINLDRFRQINDSFGHAVGDRVLQAAAERLAHHVRACDTVARLSGDQFCVLLPDLKIAHDAGDVAQKIIDAFADHPIALHESEIFVTLCVGISIYPLDGLNPEVLLRNADSALHHCKGEERSCFEYFTAQMNAAAWQRMRLETALRGALARGEFVLHYQPKVNMESGCIIGMEALLRWQSPERGLVAPGDFIALLEETGLIVPVGTWALCEACRQARAWMLAGIPGIHVAVNLSLLQFRQPDLAGVVLDALRENGLDPALNMIELELTESALMQNTTGALETLHRLHDAGIRIAIDDFGTGYSSLSYLKRLPVDSLKIDQSFIGDLCADHNDEAIVAAIIALGHSLELNVIAEGVETAAQLAQLRKMGCDQMQGYLFSHPVTADEMTYLLQNGEKLEFPVGM